MVTTGADKPRSYNGDYMEAGRVAEEVCMAFIRSNPKVVKLEDTRDLRVMREADVDCAIHLYNGRCLLAEIKSDKHLGVTGNVLFEVLRINHTCKPETACVLGWSARSPAQWLLYYAPSVQRIYLGDFRDFRAAFQAYTKAARRGTRLDYVETDAIKSTVNVLIPWEHCKDVFKVYDAKPFVASPLDLPPARR